MSSFLRWLALAAVAGLFSNVATAQTTLRWQLKPGEQLHYILSQDVVIDRVGANRTLHTKATHAVFFTWKIQSVDGKGTAKMQQTIDRLQFSMKVPGLDDIQFDSQNDEDPEGTLGKQLAPLLRAMVGSPFDVTMTAEGKITDVVVPKKILESLNHQPGLQLGVLFSEAGLKELVSKSSVVFPPQAVEKGESWASTVETEIPQLGTQKVSATYTYDGPLTRESRRFERIDVDSKVAIEPAEDAKAKVNITQQSCEGSILFDSQSGRVSESNVTLKVEMSVFIEQVNLVQKMETVTRMKAGTQP